MCFVLCAVGCLLLLQIADFVVFVFFATGGIAAFLLFVVPSRGCALCGWRQRRKFDQIDKLRAARQVNEDAVQKVFKVAQRTTLLNAEFTPDGKAKSPDAM